MARSERKRSRTPRRHRRSRSPAAVRSRSPKRGSSPEHFPRYPSGVIQRSSPDYSRYRGKEARHRPPAWLDGDISEDDIREQANGDPAEFRRLKRLKLNEQGVRCFWKNTPTPSPSPERIPRSKDGERSAENGRADVASGSGNEAATLSTAEENGARSAPAGAAQSIQDEILTAGPEAAALHFQAAELFKAWLAEEKAAAAEAEKRRKQQEEENVIVGPVPETREEYAVDYGTHMRPGEGTAMAAYVQSGKRIPRRGEVGMTADQIVSFEDLGYVMSGSRHNRMNAIRIRKENQVYTAEEKAALAMFNMEENKRKEQKILSDMQRLVQRTLGDQDEADSEPLEPAES